MNTTSRTHKLASLLITFSVIAILIMAGPANAFNLSVSSATNPTPYQGDVVSFTATFDVNTNERVPLNNLELVLSNGQTCIFSPDGNLISGCNGLTITLSSSNVNSGYGYNSFSGYGYGYQSGYGYGYNTYQPYSYGYGYGYAGYGYGYSTLSGARTYTIDINTSVFPIGTLTYYIRTVINSNTFISGSDSINIQDPDLNPVVTLNAPANGLIINNVVVNFTTNDDLDATLTCDILDNTVSVYTNTFANGNNSVSLSLSDGTHDLQVSCVDSSSQTTYSTTNTITVDTVVPSILLSSPANNFQTNNPNVTFDITGFDSTPTVDCNIYVDSNLVNSFIDLNSGSAIQSTNAFADGVHTWNTECQDEAGNWNVSETRSFTIDTIMPNITGTAPSGVLPTATASVQLTAITADDAYCRYSTTDVPYNNMTQNFTQGNLTNHFSDNLVVVSGTSYSIFVRCEDLFGNQNNESAGISFSVASPPDTRRSGGGYIAPANKTTSSEESNEEFENPSDETNNDEQQNTNNNNQGSSNDEEQTEEEANNDNGNGITGAVVGGGSNNNIWYLVAALGLVVLIGGSYYWVKFRR